ncbi:putative Protein ced-11 [Hypsibius exemplaris]|uniref:Uncharacterized protein n=1 Tax=Hypsibius exemplaris TaxID=2072580 RepID=A0A1W0WUJ6_HYPEX|nr:putative Protein ced-11 [Hypsibius exemplaris]
MESEVTPNTAGGSSSRDRSSTWTSKPFVVVPNDDAVNLPEIAAAAVKQFALSSPDIILTFVSGTRAFGTWKNEDHRAALQKGIIKIINACETWILDAGLDYGLSRMIGNAVRDEQRYRKSRKEYEMFAKGHQQQPHSRHSVVLMGITATALLEGKSDQQDPLGTDPSHTHFIFVNGPVEAVATRQANLAVELVHQTMHVLQKIPNSPSNVPDLAIPSSAAAGENVSEKLAQHEQIPLVAMLVQGDETALDMVEIYLKHGVPVLVVKGTGLMADVLAFAFEECKELGPGPHLEKLRLDMTKHIGRIFPASVADGSLENLCEKLLKCIGLAKQPDKELMSVIASSEYLSDLDSIVLPVIFAARSPSLNALPQQISKDFLLTMKLNRPNLARANVLRRDYDGVVLANNELFEKALLWLGRESFVEEFMEGDIAVHKFLNHSSLLRLFRLADNRDFFVALLEDIFPGRFSQNESFEESLVTVDLNLIIQQLTTLPKFLSMHELSSNYFGLYAHDAFVAERKAMNALMVWAVLMNRFSLAETLLKFCEDPIPMALFVSAMFRGLSGHCDASLTTKLHEQSRNFSMKAIDILDMSYRESSERTFDLLNQKFADFNNKTPIKMAYESENKFFLAHESCQIWLTRLWEGGIKVYGPTDSLIPSEAKLIISALLLFPINFWIQFDSKEFLKHQEADNAADINENGSLHNDVPLEQDDPVGRLLRNISRHGDPMDLSSPKNNETSEATLQKLEDLSLLESRLVSGKPTEPLSLNVPRKRAPPVIRYHRRRKALPFWRKVYYLWSAPRTKFWMFQLFYWVYLAIFSIAVILPSCNKTHLDAVIFIWTAFGVIELGLRTAYQARHDFPVSIRRRVIEIVVTIVFVLAAVILRRYSGLVRPLYTRALFATGLLYMYYRMISVFFPMNPDLGPTLYRIKRMILVDFVSFVRLAFPFILANLFVLQAVMYPDVPFGVETWRQGFHRAFFTLFTAFIQEIDYTPRCEATRIFNHSDTCWTGDYADHTCPTLGVISYVLNIQYWIIMRLILMVLLSALFAATMIKVKEDAEYIFKYQRYSTVLDFASRSALPPPLSVVGYLFDWIVACCARTKRIDPGHRKQLTQPRSIKLIDRRSAVIRSNESYSYWMGLTKEYYRKKAEEERERKVPAEQLKKINALSAEQSTLRGELAVLGEKLKQLEGTCTTLLDFEKARFSAAE